MATSGQRAASMAAGVAIVLSMGGVWARQKSARWNPRPRFRPHHYEGQRL